MVPMEAMAPVASLLLLILTVGIEQLPNCALFPPETATLPTGIFEPNGFKARLPFVR